MRLQAQKFFSPRTGALVDGVIEPDPDEVIMNCYRLADRFKQDPMVFLQQPLSQVDVHIIYTLKLMAAQAAARERVEDDN